MAAAVGRAGAAAAVVAVEAEGAPGAPCVAVMEMAASDCHKHF